MKFEALRRSLVRLIAPADTAPPPKNDEALSHEILSLLKKEGVIPANATATVHVVSKNAAAMPEASDSHSRPHARGIKPPDQMQWAVWDRMMKNEDDLLLEGWAPGQFGNRGRDTYVHWVFGVSRGHFGLYRMPFRCCDLSDDESEGQDERVLVAMTHLPSGLGIGVFETLSDAASAADLMTSVVREWRGLDIDNPYAPNGFRTALQAIHTAWKFGGLSVADYHAHDIEGSPPLEVWRHDLAGITSNTPFVLS